MPKVIGLATRRCGDAAKEERAEVLGTEARDESGGLGL